MFDSGDDVGDSLQSGRDGYDFYADHETGGEESSGSVVSGEAGLAHTGAVINDQGDNILVTIVITTTN